MEFKVEFKNLTEIQKMLLDYEQRHLPFAAAKALTMTAEDIKKELVKEMTRTLDRPTPYTLGSLYKSSATKKNLVASVWYKDKQQAGKGNPPVNWMLPQAEGGERSLKRFESALRAINILPVGMFIAPGAACELDMYGNIKASLIIQILSYFRAFGEQGYRANITDKGKAKLAKGSKKTGYMGHAYFASRGTAASSFEKEQHLAPGIYKRIRFNLGGGVGYAVKPIFMFVKKPSYQKRFPFNETAQRVFDQNIMKNFEAAMTEAVRTAK